ncbi:hypothetical protein BG015_008185 [Linnemannia schmuckeri]|uniref:Uncharacterized protein n=1 Tax=Linnemannia schmuckeri TaxID=64567 RepID=A0A9P5S005_9FUNG|nr:hypothetical protein BG015_008185 [Linnemannia schmuckeri]
MALTEQHAADSFFQSTHARVDSKLHSDSSSEKVDDSSFSSSLQRPLTSGLRRCAGTRDLTSIRPNVNYCAKVSVEYMMGDPSTLFHTQSWKPVVGTNKTIEDVLVDNLETVCRFKKTLYTQLYPNAEEGPQDTWPELTLYRKTGDSGYETIEGDQEALYMFALKDGDQIVLLVSETEDGDRTGLDRDSVAQWVRAIRTQSEFEAMDS